MKKIKAAIYARVSTDKQSVKAQLRELADYADRRGWEVIEVFTDTGFSGKNTKRPAFSSMMEAARKRGFDVLLVWKLDRLSRSLKDLILTVESLEGWGVDFVSYQDGAVDTTNPQGKLLFQIMGAIAEFERSLIRERVKAGMNNARANGKRIGRPSISPGVIERARDLRAQGLSYPKIAVKLNVSERSIWEKLKT